jgi:hypothetical protein
VKKQLFFVFCVVNLNNGSAWVANNSGFRRKWGLITLEEDFAAEKASPALVLFCLKLEPRPEFQHRLFGLEQSDKINLNVVVLRDIFFKIFLGLEIQAPNV